MRLDSEQRLRALTPGLSEPLAQRWVLQELDHSRGEALDVPWSHEKPGNLVFDHFRNAATAGGDDRTTDRHGLGQDAAEGLGSRGTVDEHVQPRQHVWDIF